MYKAKKDTDSEVDSLDSGEEFGATEDAAVEDPVLEVMFLQVHAATRLILAQLALVSHVDVTDVVHKQVAVPVDLLLELVHRHTDSAEYFITHTHTHISKIDSQLQHEQGQSKVQQEGCQSQPFCYRRDTGG